MKRSGKGQGISLNGGTSTINHYKQQFASTPPIAPREFVPLKVKPHPQQDRIGQFNAIPSRFA